MRLPCSSIAFSCALVLAGPALAQDATPSTDLRYKVPPADIVRILDAPPIPQALTSPKGDLIVLVERSSMPPITELAQPMLRLAGIRVNPATNGPHRTRGITGFTVKRLAGGQGATFTVPGAMSLGTIGFSPNGALFAFTAVQNDRIELWLADLATGKADVVKGVRVNGVLSDGCSWFDDSRALLCAAVPAARGAAPVAPLAPLGPNVQETSGTSSPVPTYQDLLTSAHDEALFTYYATAQLVSVDATTRAVTAVGAPAVIADATPSPDGAFILVQRIRQPYSRIVTWDDFPTSYDLWTRDGALARTLVDRPMADTVPINGVVTGPRSFRWNPTAPATVVWAEALDRGDLKVTVAQRDKVVALAAPFAGQPAELLRTEFRFTTINWTERGLMLVNESDRRSRRVRTWLADGKAAPRLVVDRGTEDSYADPGQPLRRRGSDAIQQVGDDIYYTGMGASPEGDRPFLDRLSLTTLQKTRVFHSAPNSYEQVVAVLDDRAQRLLIRRETVTDVPNYFVRDVAAATQVALTAFADPAPQMRNVTKRVISYERPDGVKLTATLYLPPGYTAGTRVPMLMWAYPQEFTDRRFASQVSGSPHRFTTVSGASHLLLLTQGYAILDDPTMPIVGPGETANDTYVEQLVASARAAVDTVVSMGVADPDRIGVGGHSYGAFMTANLLSHSDLFRAGIARSGAYNRTLTPFGFQSETRTYWEVPEIYARMSPFMHAHKVNEPILLTHGEADNNTGTFPIQSERYYKALKGHGATVRYVTLPHEAHGYAARESVLHTVAEMLDWMNLHVKAAKPRTTGTAGM